MLYSLYAPMWDVSDTLKKLLIEVLGYNNDEIKIMIAENFGRNIVNNLVIEQAKYITEIFGDNDFQIYLNDGSGSEGAIAWKELGITLSHNPPKAHYCDKPLVSREHLADLSIPKKVNPPIKESLFNTKPVIECPYCKSKNTSKIGTINRVLSIGVLDLQAKNLVNNGIVMSVVAIFNSFKSLLFYNYLSDKIAL